MASVFPKKKRAIFAYSAAGVVLNRIYSLRSLRLCVKKKVISRRGAENAEWTLSNLIVFEVYDF